MTFIINRWVRGTDFHGRDQILDDIHSRKGKPTWILGNRRSGKTSLLRQIDWLCRQNQWQDCTALYWDLQGAGNMDGLKDSFLESLEDAPEVAESLDLDVDDLEDMGFPEIVNKFRRRVKAFKGGYLLLMIDECEELVDISAESPQVLGAFRKLSGHIPHLGLILAGSLRLLDLDESASRTSPLLPDFLPPLQLKPFSQGETTKLLTEGGLASTAAETIYSLTFGNPHLTQIMGEYWARLGNHDAVIHELKHNQICQYYFDSNFNCLPADLKEAYKKGHIFNALQNLAPSDRNFSYAEQSALLRQTDDGIEISPLLYLQQQGQLPAAPTLHAPISSPVVAPAPNPMITEPPAAKVDPVIPMPPAEPMYKPQIEWQKTWHKLVDYLAKHKDQISVLPPVVLTSEDPLDWEDYQAPPSLSLMPLLGEESYDEQTQRKILRHAAPEFVEDATPNERTAVYLAGLYLHHKLLGDLPQPASKTPQELATDLSQQDYQLDLEQWPKEVDRRVAMILMRSLKQDASARYASLEAQTKDLEALLFE